MTLRRLLVCLGLISVAALVPVAGPTAPAAAAVDCQLEIVAHRGFHPTQVDENTAEAFRRAVAGGYSIETDVWADADGTLWLFHDRDVNRATGATGLIDEMSTLEVSQLRYLKAGSPLSTLEAGLDELDGTGTRLYIETKAQTDDDRNAIADLIESTQDRLDRTFITADLAWYNRNRPDIKLQLKDYRDPPIPQSAVNQGASSVSLLPNAIITPGLVDSYHDAGIEVQDRNANKDNEWRKTIDFGADGQLTDFPDKFEAFCEDTVVPPTVTSLSPAAGEPGTQVTIMGTEFEDTLEVRFGPVVTEEFTVVSDNELVVTVPPGVSAVSVVTVITAVGEATAPLPFLVPPVLASFAPAGGVPGTPVTLTGRNLAETLSVSFGGVAAPIVSVDSTTVTAVVPPSAPAASVVTLATPGGTTTGGTFSVGSSVETTFEQAPKRFLDEDVAVFRFGASVADASFTCRLDDELIACGPELRLENIEAGPHTVTVAASSPTAGSDFTPAQSSFVAPVDDKMLHGKGGWTRTREKGAWGKKVLSARSTGATLTYRLTRATAVALIVRRGPGHGSVDIFVRGKKVDTVTTAGRESTKVVRLKGFKKAKSGTLRIVTTSPRQVQIDGLGVDLE